MPIYAYRCEACGHAKDVLQKMSDPVLTACPACGADAFKKQITAAGFQLKGSGWYVPDFRGGSGGASAPAAAGAAATGAAAASPAAASASSSSSGESSSGESSSGGSSSSASSDGGGASAAGCGGPCACH
jgi:putative FmdB family regulatory protein